MKHAKNVLKCDIFTGRAATSGLACARTDTLFMPRGQVKPRGSPPPTDENNETHLFTQSATYIRLTSSAAPSPKSLTAPYSETREYKKMVMELARVDKKPSDFPQIASPAGIIAPATHVLKHHSFGLGVTSVPASTDFYGRLGFVVESESEEGGIVRLRMEGTGMRVDLVPATLNAPLPAAAAAAALALTLTTPQTTPPPPQPQNVLMDCIGWKAPGYTHASWSVPSVPAVTAFLSDQGVALSGTRSTLAIFVRDLDKTTLEFERNDGGDSPVDWHGPASIGYGRPLDHVGVRVRAPFNRHVDWWARTMGFTTLVKKYETNAEPLKNFSPWITRTEASCYVNFIPNANSLPAGGDEAAECALWEGGVVRTGILYVAYTIAEDAHTALAALRVAGADAALDSDLLTGWGNFPSHIIKPLPSGPTVMLRDLNGNIIRLVPSSYT